MGKGRAINNLLKNKDLQTIHYSELSPFGTSCCKLERRLALFLAIFPLCVSAFAQPMLRSDAYRHAGTDRHEVVIQKNGRVDVFGLGGEALFSNAYPMIQFDEDKPEPMPIDGRYTARIAFRDALGEGQELYYGKKGYEWSIRVYPLQPFVTVRCAYTNTGKKPVEVRALYPWCSGEPKPGGITPQLAGPTAIIAGGDSSLRSALAVQRLLADQPDHVLREIALLQDSESGRHLLAAFLNTRDGDGNDRYRGEIVFHRPEDPGDYADFQARSVPDRPLVVAPGDRIESATLYLAISESNPFNALERCGEAVSLWAANRTKRLLHGWYSFESQPIAPESTMHVWEPLGFGNTLLARQSANIEPLEVVTRWHDRFRDAAAPHWTWAPKTAENSVLWFGPGASLRSARRSHDALQQSVDKRNVRVIVDGRPLGAKGWADGVVYDLRDPVSLKETIRNIHESYFLGARAAPPIFLIDSQTGANQFQRDLTFAAFARAAIYLDTSAAKSDAAYERASRVAPVEFANARPQSLRPPDDATQWYADLEFGQISVRLVAVFNWTNEKMAAQIRAAAPGPNPNAYHAIYDVWNCEHLGTATGSLPVEVSANGVRLLAVQRTADAPTLLSIGNEIDLGIRHLKGIMWDPRAKLFHVTLGEFDGEKTVRILAPEGMTAQFSKIGDIETPVPNKGRVASINLPEKSTTSIRYAATP